MTRKWTVGNGDTSFDATGFGGKASAHKHAAKHFLNKSERWEQLEPAISPRKLDAELGNAGTLSERNEVLDRAAPVYEDVIERSTLDASAVRVEKYLYRDTELSQVKDSIGVVSAQGVFVAFFQAPVSVLRTAFRPLPRAIRGPRRRDFVAGAHNKLNGYLARSKELLPNS